MNTSRCLVNGLSDVFLFFLFPYRYGIFLQIFCCVSDSHVFVISAFTARGLAVLCWSFRSEICVRVNSPCQYVRHWSLHVGKIWISHWPIPNVQLPWHRQSLRQSQWQCGRVGVHQMVCGDWLVCQTISVCSNPITCTARILARAFRVYVCSDVIQSFRTAILFGRWTPGHDRLPAEPAFSNILCGMSHGDQHKTASPRAAKALIANVWLEYASSEMDLRVLRGWSHGAHSAYKLVKAGCKLGSKEISCLQYVPENIKYI